MKRFLFFILSLCLLVSCAGAEVFLAQPPQGWTQNLLRITAFPVGEGDALLIECGGEAMLLDGGPDPFREMLMTEMDSRGYRHIRYMVNSHDHEDHINGLYHLLKNGFSADSYLYPDSNAKADLQDRQSRTVALAKKNSMALGRLRNGDERSLGQARIRFYRYLQISNVNARSLVTRIDFGNASALLCADITGQTQEYFAENLPADELKADVIKVPHHGITAVNGAYLNAVNPFFAIVTNYRKGVDKIITQLEGRSIPALYSADGAVVLETDGDDWYVWQEPKETK